MKYKSLADIYNESCRGINVTLPPRQSITSFICEGGAAGHMSHPFDLPQVKTGKDLIKLFEKVAASVVQTPTSVKIMVLTLL